MMESSMNELYQDAKFLEYMNKLTELAKTKLTLLESNNNETQVSQCDELFLSTKQQLIIYIEETYSNYEKYIEIFMPVDTEQLTESCSYHQTLEKLTAVNNMDLLSQFNQVVQNSKGDNQEVIDYIKMSIEMCSDTSSYLTGIYTKAGDSVSAEYTKAVNQFVNGFDRLSTIINNYDDLYNEDGSINIVKVSNEVNHIVGYTAEVTDTLLTYGGSNSKERKKKIDQIVTGANAINEGIKIVDAIVNLQNEDGTINTDHAYNALRSTVNLLDDVNKISNNRILGKFQSRAPLLNIIDGVQNVTSIYSNYVGANTTEGWESSEYRLNGIRDILGIMETVAGVIGAAPIVEIGSSLLDIGAAYVEERNAVVELYSLLYEESGNDQVEEVIALYESGQITAREAWMMLENAQGLNARRVDPIVLDLHNNGFVPTSVEDGAYFDLDQNGLAEKINWVSGDDVILAVDRNSDGLINDGSEVFGDQTVLSNGKKANNGFEALGEFDSNGDNTIDGQDSKYSKLLVWKDENGNGISEKGELHTLKEAGIASLGLQHKYLNESTETGTIIGNVSSFSFVDGTSSTAGEYWVGSEKFNTIDREKLEEQSAFISLPDTFAMGNVYGLHKAMSLDESGKLKGLVEKFSISASRQERIGLVEEILFIITGADTIDSASRGSNIDAKKLTVVEAILGEEFNGVSGKNPNNAAGPVINEIFYMLRDMYFAEILIDSDLKFLKDSIVFGENGVVKSINIDKYIEDTFVYMQTVENKWNLLENASFYLKYLDNNGVKAFDYFRDFFGKMGEGYQVHVDIGYGNRILGTEGNNTLYGGEGVDIMVGGEGNDMLNGQNGNDSYIFNLGDGQDTISDVDYGTEGQDQIVFGEGIAPEDVTIKRDGNNLELWIKEGEDRITIQNYYYTDPNYGKNRKIEKVIFADGTGWVKKELDMAVLEIHGTEKAETLAGYSEGSNPNEIFYAGGGSDTVNGGEGNDTIYGEKGNDVLQGQNGNDTYVFHLGDGQDIISDVDYGESSQDRIIFGEGIVPEDVTVKREGDNLELWIKEGEDRIIIQNYYYTDPRYGKNRRIEKLVYADGTEWTTKELDMAIMEIHGTEKPETLSGYTSGSNPNEIFYGEGGSDTVNGGEGNDTIYGGKGNDVLQGQNGNDTYVFHLGDGQDTISDVDYGIESQDQIVFGEGIAPEDVTIKREGDNLELWIKEGEDRIIIENYHYFQSYYGKNRRIEKVVFADKTEWTTKELEEAVIEIHGTEKAETLSGFTEGSNPNEVFYAGEGNDTVSGNSGNDILYGEGGNDTLDGGDGADVIVGGSENDLMRGGNGNDTYVFHLGDGQDTISNVENGMESQDQIIFGEGIAPEDVAIKRQGDNLEMWIKEGKDRITIQNYYYTDAYYGKNRRIEKLVFSNGTQWTTKELEGAVIKIQGTEKAETLSGYTQGSNPSEIFYGGGGSDTINGGEGNDTIYGEKGNDVLQGQNGNDTYVFHLGDGQDTISDVDYGKDSQDRIVFGEGINPEDVTIKREGDNLELWIKEGEDRIIIQNYYYTDPRYGRNRRIEKLVYADGTEWTTKELDMAIMEIRGTEKPETLSGYTSGSNPNEIFYGEGGSDIVNGGEGNDTIYGGKGNDRLLGQNGNDTYVFHLGDGQDIISDVDNGEDSQDRIVFGEGIAPEDVTIKREGDNLELWIKEGDDRIIIENYHYDQSYYGKNRRIEKVVFADKTEWTTQELEAAVILIQGTEKGETMSGYTQGSNLDEIFFAKGGNDTVNGGEGNDTIYGGKGNDVLQGQNGNDTYVFHLGDGQDTISDVDNGEDSQDRIVFGEGIAPKDVTIKRQGDNLELWIKGGEDRIIIQNYHYFQSYYGKNRKIEKVVFADKTEWTTQELESAVIKIQGTEKGETLSGFTEGSNPHEVFYAGEGNDTVSGNNGNDQIHGEGGNDTLDGGDGADTIVGGLGNDLVRGGNGNDTYIFNQGDGQDTISDVDYGETSQDQITFGEGIAPEDVKIKRQGDNLELWIREGEDRITIQNYYYTDPRYGKNRKIEKLVFADGTQWTTKELEAAIIEIQGTEKADTLSGYTEGSNPNEIFYGGGGNDTVNGGEGNDTIYGGEGNDTLQGQNGNDTYVFHLGDGQDTISDVDYGENSKDQIVFGEGIDPKDVKIKRQGDNLELWMKEGEDRIIIQNYHYYQSYYGKNRKIEKVLFADKTQWTTKTLEAAVIEIHGTEKAETFSGYTEGSNPNERFYAGDGNDTVSGNNGNDLLNGGGGNDTLIGGDGADVFLGGTGNDSLTGNSGNDSYIFHLGDGQDIITDYDTTAGNYDMILFGEDIHPESVAISRNSNNLILSIMGTEDRLTVSQYYYNQSYQIEEIEFANGASCTATDINQLGLTSGTTDNPVITLKSLVTGAKEPESVVVGASADLATIQTNLLVQTMSSFDSFEGMGDLSFGGEEKSLVSNIATEMWVKEAI